MRLKIWSLICTIWFTPAMADSVGKLERVVIVARHGVRAPTKPNSALDPYSASPWPVWPVSPGELTPHGAQALRLMGAALRASYAAQGLFPASGCLAPDAVFVWSDSADHRTMQSGEQILEGLSPHCATPSHHGKPGMHDRFFGATEAGLCPIDSAALMPRVEADLRTLEADKAGTYEPALAALEKLLHPAGCAASDAKCLDHGGNTAGASEEGVRVKGPLATGSSLAEALALEYEEGMAGDSLGWGHMDLAALSTIMPLHTLYSDLLRRNPVIAGHNSSLLARALMDALDGKPVFPGQAAAPKLLLVLGHDTQLANLGGIFGVNWTLPGQPDSTPPDGAFVFELYQGGQVRVRFLYQTADQLRMAAPLSTGPGAVELSHGICGASSCAVADLRKRVEAVVPESCR